MLCKEVTCFVDEGEKICLQGTRLTYKITSVNEAIGGDSLLIRPTVMQ